MREKDKVRRRVRHMRCQSWLIKMISLNIKGIWRRVKNCAIRELIAKEKVDCFCIQETKLEILDERFAYILCESKECNWVFSASDGLSGDLCCIGTSPCLIERIYGAKKELLVVSDLRKGSLVNIVNVYAPCDAKGGKGALEVFRRKNERKGR